MFKKSILLASLLGLVSVANAANVNLDVTSSNWWGIDGTAHVFTYSSPVADASASFSFQLQGFNTVDGFNSWADAFSLRVNGNEIAGGLFDLGGGGANWPFGGTTAPVIDKAAKTVTFSNLSIDLLQGVNDFSFSYTPIGGGNQGVADEAWKLNSATITTAVPEPDTYALLLAGLGLMGAVARRRKN